MYLVKTHCLKLENEVTDCRKDVSERACSKGVLVGKLEASKTRLKEVLDTRLPWRVRVLHLRNFSLHGIPLRNP